MPHCLLVAGEALSFILLQVVLNACSARVRDKVIKADTHHFTPMSYPNFSIPPPIISLRVFVFFHFGLFLSEIGLILLFVNKYTRVPG
jgi:hypothetical protein